jgi:DNA-binding NarL/FixJ family response regulator
LEAVLREFPGVEIVASWGWLPDEIPVGGIDVLIVSSPEAGGEALLESLPDSDRLPAVLLLGDDPGATRPWIDLPFPALGALPADAGEDELAAAVTALGLGLSVWDPALLFEMQTPDPVPAEAGSAMGPPASTIEALTDRELEVLQLLGLGYANKKIALDLSISEHTVKFHISSIYGKMGAGNRTEAVRIGLQWGLISI